MHRGWDISLDNANQRMWVQVSITICAVLYKMWYSPTGTLGSLLKMTLITNTKCQHRYMWQCWSCSAAGYRPCPSSLFTLLDPTCDPLLWQFLWQTWFIYFWVKFIELNRFTRTETSPHNWCIGQRMQATVQWCWQWIHNELDAEKQTWKTSLYSNWAQVYRDLHARSPCPNGLFTFLMVQNCW
jgi:hypothetical protein